jgi:hypothetical protein
MRNLVHVPKSQNICIQAQSINCQINVAIPHEHVRQKKYVCEIAKLLL